MLPTAKKYQSVKYNFLAWLHEKVSKSCFSFLRLNGTIHTKDRKISLKIRNTHCKDSTFWTEIAQILDPSNAIISLITCALRVCSCIHSVPYLIDNMQIRQPLSQFVYSLRESPFCFNASITKSGMPYYYLFPRLKLTPLGSRVRDHLVPSPPSLLVPRHLILRQWP